VVLGNTICAYFIYITVHDAAHGAVARSHAVNDWLGRLCILPLTPFIAFSAFRYLHLQHHRATNEPERDPDYWATGARWWSLAFRFATFDLAYWVFYLEQLRQRPQREIIESITSVAVNVAVVAGLFALGIGREVLLFWILPGRLAIAVLVWVLAYLPHRPHEVMQKDDPFRATNIRFGMERWLSPLMLFQNYHLVHHLYPKEPFFLTVELWREKERFHLEQNPYLVDVRGRPGSVAQYLESRAREAHVDLASIAPSGLTDGQDLRAR
jgi:ring-1,2-phenylacetyl-CoA epoxidase subunit PaaE